MDKNCIFCKIAAGKIPAEIIHEDKNSMSFLDINPVHEGHLLIIPKKHYASMEDTPDKLIAGLFVRAKNMMPILKKSVGADFTVLTVVGTDVPHFHIHLIPRYHKDGLAGFWPPKKYESDERMKIIGDTIRKNLSNS